MRVSTDPERRLLERMGDPHLGLRVVHVTGSKGKGSTSALVAAGLQAAGLRVGRYASPHVERLQERIVIDGYEVDDVLLADGLERALEAREALTPLPEEPTWFDVLTAAALWIFRQARVEWVVAEVGLGGRLDSTNVLVAEVCVITNIELEHAAVLGGTLEAIASEKAGILKPGCTLVTGTSPDEPAGRTIAARAAELGCEVVRPRGRPSTILQGNLELARLVLDVLGRRGFLGSDGRPLGARWLDAPETIARARLPARLERFELGGVPVVLDGAHTPASVRAVAAELSRDASLPGRAKVVLGMARDKDLDGILKALAPLADRVFCTSVGTDLHRTAAELVDRARELGLAAEPVAPPAAALERALDSARGGGWVLVVGSLHLAGAVRPHLRSERNPR